MVISTVCIKKKKNLNGYLTHCDIWNKLIVLLKDHTHISIKCLFIQRTENYHRPWQIIFGTIENEKDINAQRILRDLCFLESTCI